MGPSDAPLVLLVIFPIFFVGMWLAITTFLGKASGWQKLEEIYADMKLDPLRRRFRMQSASLGGAFGMPVNYNSCLTIEACSSGLRFRLWRIFGLFRRPFMVPWRDIAVDEKKIFIFRMARLRFARWEGGQVTMRVGRWNRIAAEAPQGGLSLTS